jgi:hypothetical protein
MGSVDFPDRQYFVEKILWRSENITVKVINFLRENMSAKHILLFVSGTLLASGNFTRLAVASQPFSVLGIQIVFQALAGPWALKFPLSERLKKAIIMFPLLGLLLPGIVLRFTGDICLFICFGAFAGTGGALVHSAALELLNEKGTRLSGWLMFGLGGTVAGSLQHVLITSRSGTQSYLLSMGILSLVGLSYAKKHVPTTTKAEKIIFNLKLSENMRTLILLSLAGITSAFAAASYGRLAKAQGVVDGEHVVYCWYCGFLINAYGRWLASKISKDWRLTLTVALAWLSFSLSLLSSPLASVNIYCFVLVMWCVCLGIGLVAGATQSVPLSFTTPSVVLNLAAGISYIFITPDIFRYMEIRQAAWVVAGVPLISCFFVGLVKLEIS